MKRLLRFADSIGERSPWARMEVKKRAKWGALLVAESTAVSVVFGLLTHTTLAWSAIGAVWVIWNAGIVGLAVWPAKPSRYSRRLWLEGSCSSLPAGSLSWPSR
jgi:hypothetical protein